jgi:hypothetical protein
MKRIIAALFVEPGGPYFNMVNVDPWDELKDARDYEGPYPVIAHSPCQRWGRYWSGGPSAKVRRMLGDDGGCFKSALQSVRMFGGVLEHPEASHAFRYYELPIPKWHGGWTAQDKSGGRSCCVAQGNYGHAARKMTWLYAVKTDYPELKWGPTRPLMRMDAGHHSKEERARAVKTGVCLRLSKRQRLITPEPFRDLLLEIARSVK